MGSVNWKLSSRGQQKIEARGTHPIRLFKKTLNLEFSSAKNPDFGSFSLRSASFLTLATSNSDALSSKKTNLCLLLKEERRLEDVHEKLSRGALNLEPWF